MLDQVGDTVEWTSQSAGTRKTKRGLVVAFIGAKTDATASLRRHEPNAPRHRLKAQTFSIFDRFLVEVPREGGGYDYYAPQVATLESQLRKARLEE